MTITIEIEPETLREFQYLDDLLRQHEHEESRASQFRGRDTDLLKEFRRGRRALEAVFKQVKK